MLFIGSEYKRTTGLGNKLFPWSRAKIASEILKGKMLYNNWISPRGAGILRGGIDYKNALLKIWLVNNFVHDPESICYFRSLQVKRRIKNIYYVNDLNDMMQINISREEEVLFIFKWNTSHNFLDLQEYSTLIERKLIQITVKKQLKIISNYNNINFIGLNVRCGNDFIKADSNQPGYRKTAIDWFADELPIIRSQYGNLPAFIGV